MVVTCLRIITCTQITDFPLDVHFLGIYVWHVVIAFVPRCLKGKGRNAYILTMCKLLVESTIFLVCGTLGPSVKLELQYVQCRLQAPYIEREIGPLTWLGGFTPLPIIMQCYSSDGLSSIVYLCTTHPMCGMMGIFTVVWARLEDNM